MKGLLYVTPRVNRKTALFRFGQWVEVYPHEVMLIHPSLYEELKFEFKIAKGQKVYRTQKAARQARNNKKLVTRS